jgi:hypothetical protein
MSAPDARLGELPLPQRTVGQALARSVARSPDKLFLQHRERRVHQLR